MTQPDGPSSTAGGGYDVDVTRAPQAIRELERAREELETIRRDAVYLGHVNSPAQDRVSLDAAEVLGSVAAGGKESFVEALTQGISEVTRMIGALQAGFAAYERGDRQAGADLEQPS